MTALQALDWSVVWSYGPSLLQGLLVSLALTGIGFVVGGVGLGTLLAAASRSRRRLLRWPARAFVEFWRSTPLLVQAIWMHFAFPMLTGLRTTPFESAAIALVLNVGAYCGEIIRAGVDAVPRGQFEAGRALGLRHGVLWSRVVLPQAIRIVVPPLVGSAISVFKATAILSVLSVNDLMRVAARVSANTYQPIEVYTAAAALYFMAGLLITAAGAGMERGMRRGVA